MQWYMFARFPLEDSAGTAEVYKKAIDAFAGYSRMVDPPIEAISTLTYPQIRDLSPSRGGPLCRCIRLINEVGSYLDWCVVSWISWGNPGICAAGCG